MGKPLLQATKQQLPGKNENVLIWLQLYVFLSVWKIGMQIKLIKKLGYYIVQRILSFKKEFSPFLSVFLFSSAPAH